MMTNPLVIYHANCADGFGAAWVCRKAFPDAEFHAARHGTLPPDVTGRNVIIVDFSYDYERLACMASLARSIVVLDHHKTAQQDLARLPFAGTTNAEFWRSALDDCLRAGVPHMAALFDMQRSGAGIAWDFFFPGSPRPALIDRIEDRDLWRFALPHTREVQANLFSYPYEFAAWDALMASPIEALRGDGAAIERKHHKDVAELVKALERRMGLVEVVQVSADILPPDQLVAAKRCAEFMHRHLPEHFPEPADLILVGDYVMVDITLRMLAPRELARAQGFPDSYILDRGLFPDGAGGYVWKPVTKTDQVRLIGNSVCWEVAQALVAANAADLIELYSTRVA